MKKDRKKSAATGNESTEKPGGPTPAQLAQVGLLPTINAAILVRDFTKINEQELDLWSIRDELLRHVDAVKKGDLSRAEAILISQAHSLSAIFSNLAHRARANMGEYIEAAERYMRLALKAQNQCRATLETLAAIKNPPVLFARQANISHGPQQVNNGNIQCSTHARAENFENEPNKLLEATHGERLDPLTSRITGTEDQELVTMDALDRPKVA